MMHQLDRLKNENLDLHKQKIELMNQKEIDLKAHDSKETEKRLEYEKKIEELVKQSETEKLLQSQLIQKIECLKIELESKSMSDFTSIFKNFEDEKIKLTKSVESLKLNKKDLESKLIEEKDANENNEKFILKLNSEIDRLKIQLKDEGVDPDSQNFQKFDVKEREEMKRQLKSKIEKIGLLEKKVTKMKSEIQVEKEVYVEINI
jgi:hypothetical protein